MRTHRQSGYSLVELLIVLALLGLIAIAINGGIRFGTRVWERTEGEVESGELARGGHALLRDLLARIYPQEPDPNAADSAPAFAGERDRMAFRAMGPPAFGDGGLTHLVLTAARGPDGVSLAIVHKGERGPSTEGQETLISGAADISFAYGRIADGAIVWSDTWSGQPGVPALIRVRVAFAPGSAMRWPDLIVRPRIDKDAACIYDPVSFGCRRG